MSRHLETKSCRACASSKRKCDRRIPDCLRCSRRKIECVYPPSNPTRFILLPEDDISDTAMTENASGTELGFVASQRSETRQLSLCPMLSPPSLSFSDVDLTGVTEGYESGCFQEHLMTGWFMSMDKWEVHHMPADFRRAIDTADCKRYVVKVHEWLKLWSETGSSHFIHPRLYAKRSPDAIQDAFMANMCYTHKTPANEPSVLEVVKSRSEALVRDYDKSCDPIDGPVDANFPPEDILEGLARVQALLVYQTIGLFDGDIRLRRLAEERIPMLHCWMNQLIRQASRCVCIGSWMVLDKQQNMASITPSTANTHQWQNLLWHSWIMAESIRRTWLLCSGVQGVYLLMRDGLGSACQGGITFTSRKGVWEARSAAEWEALCARKSVGMVQMRDVGRLLSNMEPQDVDEFATFMLEANLGRDRLKSWG